MVAPITQKKLGLLGLIAVVFGPMIGSGIFNIAQNMASGAALGAVIVSWLITAVGILFLVYTFRALANKRPDLDAGIYQYAQVGFGNYVGFNMAWGYWLCTAFGNATYAVMLNDSFGAFFPKLLEHGWATVAFGTALIWIMYGIVVNGIHTASVINTVITIVKFSCLLLIGIILVVYFDPSLFSLELKHKAPGLGSFTDQIKSTMLVTIWCFLGIEGAMMMSARAKNKRDVGRAGVIGFFCAWTLYFLISVMCFGIMMQVQLADLHDPSLAYVLKRCCGEWAYYFVIISVIISLLGGWVAWSLICAQVPYEAAVVKIMPKRFLYINSKGVPSHGLLVSSIIMQVFITFVVFAKEVYLAAVQVTSMMVLPAYFFCGLFLWKASLNAQKCLHLPAGTKVWKYKVIGIVSALFCLWFMYAGGFSLLLVTSLFYLAGIFYYIEARSEYEPGKLSARLLLTPAERIIFIVLALCGIASVILLCTNHIAF